MTYSVQWEKMSTGILSIPSKIVFKNEGKVNTFLGEQNLRQFLASRFSV